MQKNAAGIPAVSFYDKMEKRTSRRKGWMTMAQEKLDYKKEYRDLYLPKRTPGIVAVPKMPFIAVEGIGAPQGAEYQAALSALYALSFTIKMSKMRPEAQIEGYFEYVVPPLEGLWWTDESGLDLKKPREQWRWISLIRQPDFVTEEVFCWAKAQCQAKKPEIDVSKAYYWEFEEGLCVQVLHIGPYSQEQASIDPMLAYAHAQGYEDVSSDVRKHHEIYLSDPRKTAPDRLKTVLRLPIEKKVEA